MSNTEQRAETPNNEALAAKISEYGSLMFSAGMDAASDFRDRHRDSKEKCAEADELLDEIVAAIASSGQAASAVPEGVMDWNRKAAMDLAQRLEEANHLHMVGRTNVDTCELLRAVKMLRVLATSPEPAREVVPDAVFEIVQRVYDNIEPGALAENRAHIESIVQPYLDAIMDELRELDAAPASPTQPASAPVAPREAQAQAAEVHLAKAIELLEQARLIAYDAHLDPTEWDLSVIAFLTLVAPSSNHAELPEPSAKA